MCNKCATKVHKAKRCARVDGKFKLAGMRPQKLLNAGVMFASSN